MNMIINNDDDNKAKEILENINKKNEMFVTLLRDKNSFSFEWYSGAVMRIDDPQYYDDRINVTIKKINNLQGNINFGKDSYQLTDSVFNNLYNYIETNIEKLIKIALNQNTDMYVGVVENLKIKYKSVYLQISGFNATTEEDKEAIKKVKEDIKNIISVNEILNNNEINN